MGRPILRENANANSLFGLKVYVEDRLGHDSRYAIDSTKLKTELGWEPTVNFEEGIELTVKWYLENQEWLNHISSGEYINYNNKN